jgi:hypothetical protein
VVHDPAPQWPRPSLIRFFLILEFEADLVALKLSGMNAE